MKKIVVGVAIALPILSALWLAYQYIPWSQAFSYPPSIDDLMGYKDQTKSERAIDEARRYVAAGLATEFSFDRCLAFGRPPECNSHLLAGILRLTTANYPESLAYKICTRLPIGIRVLVYHPDIEGPVAQCEGDLRWWTKPPEFRG